MSNAIVVSDAGPLITLAKADNLDLLLKQQLPIQIPDAVIVEAARSQRADSLAIARWVNDHPDRVKIVVTEKGVEQIARLSTGESIKNYGEKAAVEAASSHLDKNPANRAFLLYEDHDVKNEAKKDPRISLLPTAAFLQALENTAQIPSARLVLEQTAATGRNVDNQIAQLTTPSTQVSVGQFVQQNADPMEKTKLLEQVLPNQAQNFHFRHEHPDGVTTFQHNQTKGLVHIHPDGQTLDKHGVPVNPAKALESALSPQAEKSNGIDRAMDSGPGTSF